MSTNQPIKDDDVEEAECGSTSWRIMTGRAKKGHLSKQEAASPPNQSDYVTPHPQSGPIRTPTVPRPMKGRVTRSAGGTTTLSGVYSQSPATAGKMKKVVPAPPFGFHSADADTTSTCRSSTSDGTSQGSSTSKLRWQGKGSCSRTVVKGGVVRAVESASAIARDSNSSTLDEGDTGSAHIKEEIQVPNLVPSFSSATITTDTKSTLVVKRSVVVGPDRSDSLEDELLEQEAAANIADVCDEKDHAATTSFASAQSANSDPLGGHDSLEVLMEKGMELVADGAEKSNKC